MSTTLTIEETTDYGKFQIMGGNREVDLNHVQRLEKEMQYNPEMFKAQPILVNENFYIVDGQHRFNAARNLNVPVYYVKHDKLTVEAARHLNTTQKRWTLIDFAKSHAEGGRMDYIQFLRYNTQFANLNAGIVILYLQGSSKHSAETEFRKGNFKILDEENAVEHLKQLQEIQSKTGEKINTPMARAFMKLFVDDNEFDIGVFMQKLERDTARDDFHCYGIVRNCLRSIEDVYNFQSKIRTRLY